RYTGNPTLGTAKTDASRQRHAEQSGIPSSYEEIMRKADIVIGTSGVPGLINPGMVKKGQIIFALSNPQPEIVPEQAIAAGAVIAADGKSVNNLLGFPGIWRGTMDAKATKITYEMYCAAALAIADSTNEGEFVPNPLDPKVHLAVTHGVARAAMESGVARHKLDSDYFERSEIKKFVEI
ncbi:malic enzyme-like NAD(P)-binding protein, partial [Chloroflexota bacterium]